MIKKALLDEILRKFLEFDDIQKKYEQNFSERNLNECIYLLLGLDALVSQAEFEEINDFSKAERYISNLSYKIGFKGAVKLLELLLENAKKINKDDKIQSDIVGLIGKGKSNFSLTINKELRARLNELYHHLPNVDIADVSDIESSIEEIATNFEELYGIKVILIKKVNSLLKINSQSAEMLHAKKELLIRFSHYEEQLTNHITFIITKCIHTLKTLEYFRRYESIKDKIEFAFKNKKVISLKAVMESALGEKYNYELPLGIDYKNPSNTFEKEANKVASILVFPPEFSKIREFLARLTKFITHEYNRRNDSSYHAIEHTAQNLITSIRFYEIYGKRKQLTMYDFFISCVSSLFHDTGYFYDHFSDVAGHYLSSMNHVGHEMLSIQYARRVLSHYKDEILGFFPKMDFDEFINSVGNVISGTQLEKPAFNENRDIYLLCIIRAADLLEMCSENYADFLVALFIDNRIGAPEKKWPSTIMDLIGGTYWFMRESDYVKLRVDPMMKYLSDYPQYHSNREVISENVKLFCNYMKKEKIELDAAFEKFG